MKQVLIKGGEAVVEEVPAPQVGPKHILVAVTCSCVSVGTEMAGLKMSGLPLYRRALKQPDNVKRVLEMMRDQGVKRTMDRVRGKLSAGSPTGYSASGVVVAIGSQVEGFAVGDRVACAGAGIANHAELIDVPVNLAVEIPQTVSDQDAATVTLGAIAMQGVRRTNPTLGETIVVIGLGILGQITVRLLKANGCRVIGTDLDENKIDLAVKYGMDRGIQGSEDLVDRVIHLTDGYGADAVVVAAATASDEVISRAMRATRKKGRVVLVGDVGLNLKRGDFYTKELDFFISTSYGPGRYDPVYEEGGQDYPLAYVRWTENRNMETYLQLLAGGELGLGDLPTENYPVDQASKAYAKLEGEGEKPLLVFLEYDTDKTVNSEAFSRRVDIGTRVAGTGIIRVGLVGASSFAQGVHLPNMVKLRDGVGLHAVMSRTGSGAKAVAKQYEAKYATTDYSEILRDPDVDLVMITTRHNLHGKQVLEALQAGKHVFVEKPLAMQQKELDAIARFYSESESPPLLMSGFNRRFSPAIRSAQSLIAHRSTPLIVNYRMNAGFIPPDHWVHGEEGGGRNIGEACHIYDLFNALTGAKPVSVNAESVNPSGKQWLKNDNFVATVKYSDGSVCSLTYTALGSKDHPKERMDIYCDGMVISMDDYKSLEVSGLEKKGWSSPTMQKGQMEELEALVDCLGKGAEWPISLEQQLAATQISFDVEAAIRDKSGE